MMASETYPTVGIRQLKARLSGYLKRVERGERVTVTDRGRAVALLTPIDPSGASEWIHALVAKGGACWGGGKPAGLRRRIDSRGKPASEMVIEDRR